MTYEPVAIKMLKEVKLEKVKREVRILQEMNQLGGPYRLVGYCQEPGSGRVALVSSLLEGPTLSKIGQGLQAEQVKKYVYQLLRTLDFAHSRGIMHRDVKPVNVIVNPTDESVSLIDWGLAEFYLPGRELNLRVATRPFKGPELMCGLRDYDYRLDVWSVACILAALVRQADPDLPQGLHVPRRG